MMYKKRTRANLHPGNDENLTRTIHADWIICVNAGCERIPRTSRSSRTERTKGKSHRYVSMHAT